MKIPIRLIIAAFFSQVGLSAVVEDAQAGLMPEHAVLQGDDLQHLSLRPGGRCGLSLHELRFVQTDIEFYTPERDQYAVQPMEAKTGDTMPKVLLIGDSIMSGYFQQTQQLLEGEARVLRHPGNAGDTRNALDKLNDWLGDTQWDVIHFNWGLHDLCYRHPEATVYGKRDKVRGSLSVPLDEYAKNLEALVQRLKQTKAKLVFATTTCIPEGEAGRFVGDDVKYNQAALEVMQRHDIAVNDLHAVSSGFGPEMYVAAGDVHHAKAGNMLLARQVAEAIRQHAGLK